MSQIVRSRIQKTGQKKILSLDGGGIKGILTLQYLKDIEKIVKKSLKDDNAVLSDYFDLIGGTSTGAIIAAALSLGWDVDKVENMYEQFGEGIFKSTWTRKGILRAKFSAEALRARLEDNFGEVLLGGDELYSALAVVCKRLDTGSPWVLHNNPDGAFYNPMPDGTIGNKDYFLKHVVRASTAAPSFFDPEPIQVGNTELGAFVDGGVSPHNNPALQMLMLGILPGYNFNWKIGAKELLIVSVGTGMPDVGKLSAEDVLRQKAVKLAVTSLSAMMDDASALNETMMQMLSHCSNPRKIDSEVGEASLPDLSEKLCTYIRYQPHLTEEYIQRLGLSIPEKVVKKLSSMDEPKNMPYLIELGNKASALEVKEKHFGSFI